MAEEKSSSPKQITMEPYHGDVALVKAVGIDSGTKTMDIFGFDDKDGNIIIDVAIPRDEITKSAKLVVEKLREAQKSCWKNRCNCWTLRLWNELKKAKDATDEEIADATFVTEADIKRRLRIIGLRELMLMLRERRRFKHMFHSRSHPLITVPKYRKAKQNRYGNIR